MHLLVTRPEPDATDLKARLEAAGHRVSVEPLLRIEPLGLSDVQLGGVQALIVTSRNALRVLQNDPRLEEIRRLPLFAVGPQTKELACDLGFDRVTMGPGSARELAPIIAAVADPQGGALLHLSGDVVAFDMESALAACGLHVVRAVVYRSAPATRLSAQIVNALEQGTIDGVILMSGRTAETWVQLIEAHGLRSAAQRLIHLCLSQAVADRLTALAPARQAIAMGATSEQMLALIGQIAPQLAQRSP